MRRSNSQKASVALVSLCLVAVLGIALSSYLAVSNQAMKLSNRSLQTGVSEQLAETGLELGLWAFNFPAQNDWATNWITTGTTATRTVTFGASKYGNIGVIGSINLRVDHYNATVWSALATYSVGSCVWYQGVWYQCIISPTANQSPSNTTYWISGPVPWSSSSNYYVGNIVISGGTAYRCILGNNNQPVTSPAYWTGYTLAVWAPATSYATDDVALFGGTAYRCIIGNSNQPPPSPSYWVSAPVIYSQGVATLPDNGGTQIKTQLHAQIAPAPLFPNAIAASSNVNLYIDGIINSYNSIGDSTASNPGSSAVVAGGNISGIAVSITRARVNGYVAAPSSSGSPSLWNASASGILTSTPAPTIPSPRVDLTRVSPSPFIPQFDIQPVSGATLLTLVPNTSNTIGTPGATSPSVYYINSDVYLGTSTDIITINGPVILDIRGFLGVADGMIIVTTTGSAEIHFSGVLYFSGNGGIQNQTLNPKKCILIGTSTINSYNSHVWAPSIPFHGAIYMPNAYLTVESATPIFGALSAKNITFTTTANLHYDTSLRTATFGGVDEPFTISEWRELTDGSERITLP